MWIVVKFWLYSLGSKLKMVGWILHFSLLHKTCFVWLDPLTRPVISPINIFLIKLNITLYHVIFIKYLWTSKKSLVSIGLNRTEKNFTTPFNPVFSYYYIFFHMSFEILPNLNTVDILFFWVFCFEFTYFCSINKLLLSPLYCRLNINLFPGCVKLIGILLLLLMWYHLILPFVLHLKLRYLSPY